MRSDYRPTRYFVQTFTALIIADLIILPVNLGLLPSLVRNSELFILIGGTFDAILLALVLADKIRILSNKKDPAIVSMQNILTLTHTDHLTGIVNHYAFDQDIQQLFK